MNKWKEMLEKHPEVKAFLENPKTVEAAQAIMKSFTFEEVAKDLLLALWLHRDPLTCFASGLSKSGLESTEVNLDKETRALKIEANGLPLLFVFKGKENTFSGLGLASQCDCEDCKHEGECCGTVH